MPNAHGQDAANLEPMRAAVAYQAAICHLVETKLTLRAGTGYLLDFGAGRGDYAVALQKRTEMRVVSLEPDSRLHPCYPAGIPVVANLCALAPGCAACAYSLNVLEHIAEDAQALHELAARCKAGAFIFLLVPANPSLWTQMDTHVGHYRRYTAEALRQTVAQAGLELVEEGWFDRTGYVATRAYQLLNALIRVKHTRAGELTKAQVCCFDALFRLSEPVLSAIGLPFGKNRWVLARKPR